jgi:uncharacterized protein with NRDE domain
MCLIALAWGMHPDYPLVLAANRDEWYARPTAPLAQWRTDSGHTIISGRDLQGGGTWMGFSPSGRFAMLTNVRKGAASASSKVNTTTSTAPSRGLLAVDWLCSLATAESWFAQQDFAAFADFNLIVGDWSNQQVHYVSNQALSDAAPSNIVPEVAAVLLPARSVGLPQSLKPGYTIGLSNAALNTPWPKTTRLTAALNQAVHSTNMSPAELAAVLQQALCDTQLAPLALLPSTGISIEKERMLSAVLVRSPTYGTRSSTTLVLDSKGLLHALEITHHLPPYTDSETQSHLTTRWPQDPMACQY